MLAFKMQFLDYKINTISDIAVGFHMHGARLLSVLSSSYVKLPYHQSSTKAQYS
jgi:hypothetical protein